MRYFRNIPEDFLRDAFQYDPNSPSGLVRLRSHSEHRDNANHIYKHGQNGFHASIMIDGKKHRKYFSFGVNGKSEQQAESEAHAFIEKTQNENPQSIKTAGHKNELGCWYDDITYNGKPIPFLVHRLVFFLHNENIDIEGMEIDHIDNNPSNNKKENLKISKTNKTGTKGLFDNVKTNTFQAKVCFEKKLHQKSFPYGINPTEEHKEKIRAIAINWLRETRQRLHKDFTNQGDTE